MKRPQLLALVAVGLATLYAGRLAWRAHKNIVTLDVHNMKVADVAKKLRWQTWESITVHKDLTNRVTIQVEDQPLVGVLALIADQCEGRWSVAYPLYTTGAKLALAKRVATGEVESPQPGWTNWNARPNFAAIAARMASGETNAAPGAGGPGGGFGGGPGGMFGMNEGPAIPKPVTFDFAGQTPVEAAAELRKFGKVKIVPEDGTLRPVKLELKDASMDKAVAQLAKWVGRKWAKFYAIEPRGGFRPTAADREAMAAIPRPDMEQMRQRFQNFEPTPEMQARMTQRMLDGIKNSTPEQRAQRGRRFGGGGGPGGGGPGGGGGGRGAGAPGGR